MTVTQTAPFALKTKISGKNFVEVLKRLSMHLGTYHLIRGINLSAAYEVYSTIQGRGADSVDWKALEATGISRYVYDALLRPLQQIEDGSLTIEVESRRSDPFPGLCSSFTHDVLNAECVPCTCELHGQKKINERINDACSANVECLFARYSSHKDKRKQIIGVLLRLSDRGQLSFSAKLKEIIVDALSNDECFSDALALLDAVAEKVVFTEEELQKVLPKFISLLRLETRLRLSVEFSSPAAAIKEAVDEIQRLSATVNHNSVVLLNALSRMEPISELQDALSSLFLLYLTPLTVFVRVLSTVPDDVKPFYVSKTLNNVRSSINDYGYVEVILRSLVKGRPSWIVVSQLELLCRDIALLYCYSPPVQKSESETLSTNLFAIFDYGIQIVERSGRLCQLTELVLFDSSRVVYDTSKIERLISETQFL